MHRKSRADGRRLICRCPCFKVRTMKSNSARGHPAPWSLRDLNGGSGGGSPGFGPPYRTAGQRGQHSCLDKSPGQLLDGMIRTIPLQSIPGGRTSGRPKSSPRCSNCPESMDLQNPPGEWKDSSLVFATNELSATKNDPPFALSPPFKDPEM